MPGVSVDGDRHEFEDSGCRELLALYELWRNLERLAIAAVPVRRTHMALNTRRLLRELKELIAALDRRVPRVERAGEAKIAREAAALRAKALKRIAELERESVKRA